MIKSLGGWWLNRQKGQKMTIKIETTVDAYYLWITSFDVRFNNAYGIGFKTTKELLVENVAHVKRAMTDKLHEGEELHFEFVC